MVSETVCLACPRVPIASDQPLQLQPLNRKPQGLRVKGLKVRDQNTRKF
jgi:hypothetical protein